MLFQVVGKLVGSVILGNEIEMGGGRGREPFEFLAQKFFELVGETVESKRPTGDEAKKKCRALGKELVKKLK